MHIFLSICLSSICFLFDHSLYHSAYYSIILLFSLTFSLSSYLLFSLSFYISFLSVIFSFSICHSICHFLSFYLSVDLIIYHSIHIYTFNIWCICLFITDCESVSLSSLVSSRFSPHMVPHPPHGLHQTGIPHPAIVSPAIKQEPCADNGSNLTHGWVSVLHYSLTVISLLFSNWHRLCIHLCPYRKPSVLWRKREERGSLTSRSPKCLYALHEGNEGQSSGRMHPERERSHQPDPGQEGERYNSITRGAEMH